MNNDLQQQIDLVTTRLIEWDNVHHDIPSQDIAEAQRLRGLAGLGPCVEVSPEQADAAKPEPRRFTWRELECYENLLTTADGGGDMRLDQYEAQFVLSMFGDEAEQAIDDANDAEDYAAAPDKCAECGCPIGEDEAVLVEHDNDDGEEYYCADCAKAGGYTDDEEDSDDATQKQD